jgi:hypothetical protein
MKPVGRNKRSVLRRIAAETLTTALSLSDFLVRVVEKPATIGMAQCASLIAPYAHRLLLAGKRAATKGENFMPSRSLTTVMQVSISLASLCVAIAAITFALKSMSEERNARLVEIGVGVLRVDPSKEDHITAAREWALNLIDANAGGVKFSREARAELLKKPFDWQPLAGWTDLGSFEAQPSQPSAKSPQSN